MASPDFFMGAGDSLPIITTTLIGADGNPMDLTGCTVTLERALARGGGVVVRSVTPDPDQVANPGKVTCKVFDAGQSVAGDYEARFIVIDGSGEEISFLNDRLLTIEVTRRPGT